MIVGENTRAMIHFISAKLAEIQNEAYHQVFLCHTLSDLWSYENAPVHNGDDIEDMSEFIRAGIAIPELGANNDTFGYWLDRQLAWTSINWDGTWVFVTNNARRAWMDRLVYFIDQGAKSIYPDGEWRDANDKLRLPNGDFV